MYYDSFEQNTGILAVPNNAKTDAILAAVSFTGNGKTATVDQQRNVLELVRLLETTAPPPIDLLTKQAQRLDGNWFLQYTSPSELEGNSNTDNAWTPEYASEGASNIETRQFNARGTVSAAGVTVDTSNRMVQQIFDVGNRRVVNEVTTDWGKIIVSGGFRPSEKVPNRALVAFDTATIEWKGIQFHLGFVFSVLALVRQSRDNGWLETTYIDERMRLGRGNKGTLFVLTRDQNAVQP